MARSLSHKSQRAVIMKTVMVLFCCVLVVAAEQTPPDTSVNLQPRFLGWLFHPSKPENKNVTHNNTTTDKERLDSTSNVKCTTDKPSHYICNCTNARDKVRNLPTKNDTHDCTSAECKYRNMKQMQTPEIPSDSNHMRLTWKLEFDNNNKNMPVDKSNMRSRLAAGEVKPNNTTEKVHFEPRKVTTTGPKNTTAKVPYTTHKYTTTNTKQKGTTKKVHVNAHKATTMKHTTTTTKKVQIDLYKHTTLGHKSFTKDSDHEASYFDRDLVYKRLSHYIKPQLAQIDKHGNVHAPHAPNTQTVKTLNIPYNIQPTPEVFYNLSYHYEYNPDGSIKTRELEGVNMEYRSDAKSRDMGRTPQAVSNNTSVPPHKSESRMSLERDGPQLRTNLNLSDTEQPPERNVIRILKIQQDDPEPETSRSQESDNNEEDDDDELAMKIMEVMGDAWLLPQQAEEVEPLRRRFGKPEEYDYVTEDTDTT